MELSLKKDGKGYLKISNIKKTYNEIPNKFYKFIKSLNKYPVEKSYDVFMAHLEEMLLEDLEIVEMNYDGYNIIIKTVEFRGTEKHNDIHILKVHNSYSSDVNFVVHIEEFIMKLSVLKPLVEQVIKVREETMNTLVRFMKDREYIVLSDEQQRLVSDYIRIQKTDDFVIPIEKLPHGYRFLHNILFNTAMLYGGNLAFLFTFTGKFGLLFGSGLLFAINFGGSYYMNKKQSNEIADDIYYLFNKTEIEYTDNSLVDPLIMDVFLEDILKDIQDLKYVKLESRYLEELENLANEYVQAKLNELMEGIKLDKYTFLYRLTELELNIALAKENKNIRTLHIPDIINRLSYLDISEDSLENDPNILQLRKLFDNSSCEIEKIMVIRYAQDFVYKKYKLSHDELEQTNNNLLENFYINYNDLSNSDYKISLQPKKRI